MKQQKKNKWEYKVQCTITTSNHKKICYPFKGCFNNCRLFIYTTALSAMTAKRRSCNLENFFGFSMFDVSGLIFFSIKRTEQRRLRIKVDYEIIKNN